MNGACHTGLLAGSRDECRRRLADRSAAPCGSACSRSDVLALANCSAAEKFARTDKTQRIAEDAEIAKGGGHYKLGKPYSINGQTYTPTEEPNYRAEGIASWYGPDFHGRLTANGETLQHARLFGGASDTADSELCPRDQSQERQVDHRAGQQSRSVRAQPAGRSFGRYRQGARLLRPRHHPCAARICRPRSDRRQRRPHAARDAARRIARRPRPRRSWWLRPSHSCRRANPRRHCRPSGRSHSAAPPPRDAPQLASAESKPVARTAAKPATKPAGEAAADRGCRPAGRRPADRAPTTSFAPAGSAA